MTDTRLNPQRRTSGTYPTYETYRDGDDETFPIRCSSTPFTYHFMSAPLSQVRGFVAFRDVQELKLLLTTKRCLDHTHIHGASAKSVFHVELSVRQSARLGRVNVVLFTNAVATVLVARDVHVRPRAGRRPRNFVLDSERVDSTNDAKKAHFTPILAPGVTNDPILRAIVRGTPTDDGDDVVDFKLRSVRVDASDVSAQAVGIDAGGHWASGIDLGHDFLFTGDHPVFRHGRVRERAQRAAKAAEFDKRAARSARVHRRARIVTASRAVPFGGFRATRFIGQARVVRHESSVVHELIRARVRASVARTGDLGPAVQNVLNRQIHILRAVLPARDLDAITERAHGAVRPARTAVLRNVLVERLGQEVVSLHVVPHESRRKFLGVHVLMRARAEHVRTLRVPGHDLVLVEPLRRRGRAGDSEGRGAERVDRERARERARRDAREDDQHERDGDRSNTSRFHRVPRSTRDYDARGGRRPSNGVRDGWAR